MRSNRKKAFLAFFIFCSLIFVQNIFAESKLVQNRAESDRAQEAVKKAFSNAFVVKTGQIKNGEQIPVPSYKDGTQAKREDCQYFVSPREISTAFSHLVGSGVYFVRCFVDEDGYVSISLWQQGSDGKEYDVSKDQAYDDLKKYYDSIGTQYEGHDDFRNRLMEGLKRRMTANYMVIAVRS